MTHDATSVAELDNRESVVEGDVRRFDIAAEYVVSVGVVEGGCYLSCDSNRLTDRKLFSLSSPSRKVSPSRCGMTW
jgi:hypothetical protein